MSILSMPRGPRVVLRTSAMIWAAIMFDLRASRPRLLVEPSFKISTGLPVKYAKFIASKLFENTTRVRI